MPDQARIFTDKKLESLSKRITSEYGTARSDLKDKFDKYMTSAESRLKGLTEALETARQSGDKKQISIAEQALIKAKQNITFNDKRYREMIDDITDRLADVNGTALKYVNNSLATIYKSNYNQAKQDADSVGMTFSMMNEDAVAALVKKGEIQLPKKKLQVPKDKEWNRKQLNSAVLQGIIQGETMREISKRILPIVDNNRNAAIRNARTMVTGAENEGRQDSWKKLSDDGAVVKRVWISTADSRTREAHLVMDGQEVDIDQPFTDGDGNEIMYPGDPSAEPCTVYNCRCSMRTHIIGFRKPDGSVERIPEKEKKGITSHQKAIWEEANKRADFYGEQAYTIGDSFVNQLEKKQYSPHMSAFSNYNSYISAKREYDGAPTTYLSDIESRELRVNSSWSGYDEKIPKIDSAIASLTEEYPIAPSENREYQVSISKLVVCDYENAYTFLPDGENDRRISWGEASAQVFLNENQAVMAFNRELLPNSLSEAIHRRAELVSRQTPVYDIACGNAEITAIHEFGHLASVHIDNASIYEDASFDRYYEWYKSLSSVDIENGISSYATANRGEFEAECFAELHMPNPRPIALKFKEFLDEIVKKGY